MEKRLEEIIQVALKYHVSDIHFSYDTTNDKTIIEMRIHDCIKRLKQEENDTALFHYLKYRANLDVSNAFLPQTGSFDMEMNRMHLSMRFAVVNSYHIASGVLRILNNHPVLKIDELTKQTEAITWMDRITEHKSGLFLFSGPTSSGKTTSLYTILSQTKNKKIFTLEDPIEIQNENMIQLQINESQHLSYGEGIKQLMRHDPDILMIGEIRDEEAAQMAVRCALTGHLVVSSIHSVDCVGAIVRMRDLGVKEYELKDTLYGVSNQRLYETTLTEKIGVYEIMDRKEVMYYLAHRQTSTGFKSLDQHIQEAVDQGIITKEKAKEDLFHG